MQSWHKGLPNAVSLPGSQQGWGRSSFSHNKPYIIILQTVSSSGKLASANRASFRPHSLATIYHAKKNAVNETNRRKSDPYLLLAEAINPLWDTLLIALLLRGGRANKEQQQIAVYGTIYQHFCPIRLDAQMTAFIRAMSFILLEYSSWCCI